MRGWMKKIYYVLLLCALYFLRTWDIKRRFHRCLLCNADAETHSSWIQFGLWNIKLDWLFAEGILMFAFKARTSGFAQKQSKLEHLKGLECCAAPRRIILPQIVISNSRKRAPALESFITSSKTFPLETDSTIFFVFLWMRG